jgi:pimeloyl-ACP methyl ester carboxylesterase
MPKQRLSTGIDLYYESHGEGEPLVLIPGTGFGGNVWFPSQVPTLSKKLRVITLDVRGCGRSSAPEGVYTIEQMACDVAALLDHLGLDQAHVLGHSMGGRIGIALALVFPGRVRSLILAAAGSGPAARSGEECVPGLPYRIVNELVEMGFEKFVRNEVFDTTTYFTKDYLQREPEKVATFYEMAWKYHAKWQPFLRLVMARHAWEGTHRLGDISVPTLVVIGDNDDFGSNHVKQAEAVQARIPNAERLVLQGQSHGFFWQAPEETNAWILDWVTRHSASSRIRATM